MGNPCQFNALNNTWCYNIWQKHFFHSSNTFLGQKLNLDPASGRLSVCVPRATLPFLHTPESWPQVTFLHAIAFHNTQHQTAGKKRFCCALRPHQHHPAPPLTKHLHAFTPRSIHRGRNLFIFITSPVTAALWSADAAWTGAPVVPRCWVKPFPLGLISYPTQPVFVETGHPNSTPCGAPKCPEPDKWWRGTNVWWEFWRETAFPRSCGVHVSPIRNDWPRAHKKLWFGFFSTAYDSINIRFVACVIYVNCFLNHQKKLCLQYRVV